MFFNTKINLQSYINIIRTWLIQKKGYSIDKAIIAIAKYYITLIEADRIRIYNKLKNPNFKIRILATIDAIALGYNILDIKYAI